MTSDVPGKRSPLELVRLGSAAAIAIAALMLAGGAHGVGVDAPINLGTVSVLGDTVIVSGSVNDTDASLQINGKPVTVSGAGGFTTAVDLGGGDKLVLALDDGNTRVTTEIPLSVLESEGANALTRLQGAGISIDVPPGGFRVVDGTGPIVTGSVENPEALKSLTVNGRSVLPLGPGGAFTATPRGPGVTVAATDTRGVSQSRTFSTRSASTVMRTRAGTSVSAEGAQGIRIAKLQLVKTGLRKARRLGLVVIVQDRRGFLIRGASVRVHGKPLRFMAGSGAVRAGFTNRIGRSRFGFRVHPAAFKRCACARLTLTVRASTPRASAKKALRLRLPARTRG